MTEKDDQLKNKVRDVENQAFSGADQIGQNPVQEVLLFPNLGGVEWVETESLTDEERDNSERHFTLNDGGLGFRVTTNYLQGSVGVSFTGNKEIGFDGSSLVVAATKSLPSKLYQRSESQRKIIKGATAFIRRGRDVLQKYSLSDKKGSEVFIQDMAGLSDVHEAGVSAVWDRIDTKRFVFSMEKTGDNKEDTDLKLTLLNGFEWNEELVAWLMMQHRMIDDVGFGNSNPLEVAEAINQIKKHVFRDPPPHWY